MILMSLSGDGRIIVLCAKMRPEQKRRATVLLHAMHLSAGVAQRRVLDILDMRRVVASGAATRDHGVQLGSRTGSLIEMDGSTEEDHRTVRARVREMRYCGESVSRTDSISDTVRTGPAETTHGIVIG